MSLLTSAPISALAVELLRRSLVLPNTVSRVSGPEFAGPSGGTVTLRVPQPRTARTQTTPGTQIDYADLDEIPVTVQVAHLYDACKITDEDLSLTIEEFGRQVLKGQVVSVATAAENVIADEMNALTPDGEIVWDADPDPVADLATILAVRQRMTEDGVPAAGRYMAVSPSIATRVLSIPTVHQAGDRGSTDALASATIGSLFGLTFVESSAIEDDTAVAYGTSGFAFGTLPPVAPRAAADSTTVSEGGVSMRHLLAFDVNHLSTASVVSVFAGCSVIVEDDRDTVTRAIRIETAGS